MATEGCCAAISGIVIILCCATLVVNIVAIVNRGDEISLCWYVLSFFLQGCVVLRFYEEWRVLDNDVENGNKSRQLRRVRFSQALLNSAPQCILQLYIMVETWNCPSYAIASLFVSSISFVLGFYAHSPPHSSVVLSLVLFIGKLGLIISRVVLVTFSFYSFSGYLFNFLIIRIVTVVYVCIKIFGCCGCREGMLMFLGIMPYQFLRPILTSQLVVAPVML